MDAVGRVRVLRERREQLLREFATSGISAELAGANPVTFYSWVQKKRASETGCRFIRSVIMTR